MAILLAFVFSISSVWASSDFYGFASIATHLYTVRTSTGKTILQMPESEIKSALLESNLGVVQDRFDRVTGFNAAGHVIVNRVLGRDFKVSQNLIGIYSDSFGQVYRRDGRQIFFTGRPVGGLTVADSRFGWIDSGQETFELRDLNGLPLQVYRGRVQNAWMSDQFVALKAGSSLYLYGKDLEQLPSENAEGTQVQLSNHFAVLQLNDHSVKVYQPNQQLFTRFLVQPILKRQYLALKDASGFELYRNNGSFAGHFQSGQYTEFGDTTVAIHLASGAIQLLDLNGDDGEINQTVIPSGPILITARLALTWSEATYDVYSLESKRFGVRIGGGVRLAGAASQPVVGLNTFGWLNSGFFKSQVTDGENILLDESYVTRIDLPVEGQSLNWTRF